jgi:hypothetical protein
VALAYEDNCPAPDPCDIWLRLFDPTGTPRQNQLGHTDADVAVNQASPSTLTLPAVAALPAGNLLSSWVIANPPDLRARALGPDAAGLAAGEFSLLSTTSFDRAPQDSMVATFDRNRYFAIWSQERNLMPLVNEPLYVHGRLINADGTGPGDFVINGPNPGVPDPHANDDHVGPYVAVGPSGVMVAAWTRGAANCSDPSANGSCELRARWFDSGGQFAQQTDVPIAMPASITSIQPAVAAVQDSFLIVWADKVHSGPDTDDFAIVARRYDRGGTALWTAEAVLDTLGTGPQIQPAIAAQSDGRTLVVWTDCSARGEDMEDCGIRGRALLPFGMPVGGDFQINTTYHGRQSAPSVVAVKDDAFFVAFSDDSGTPPDSDGAVRGRFIYPVFDRDDGVVGARCDGDHPCGSGLSCVQRQDGSSLCHVSCQALNQPCETGGVCMQAPGGTSCVYP